MDLDLQSLPRITLISMILLTAPHILLNPLLPIHQPIFLIICTYVITQISIYGQALVSCPQTFLSYTRSC